MLKKVIESVLIFYIGLTLYNMWHKKFWTLPDDPFVYVMSTVIYGMIAVFLVLDIILG